MQQPHGRDLVWMIKRVKFSCSLKKEKRREEGWPGMGG